MIDGGMLCPLPPNPNGDATMGQVMGADEATHRWATGARVLLDYIEAEADRGHWDCVWAAFTSLSVTGYGMAEQCLPWARKAQTDKRRRN